MVIVIVIVSTNAQIHISGCIVVIILDRLFLFFSRMLTLLPQNQKKIKNDFLHDNKKVRIPNRR